MRRTILLICTSAMLAGCGGSDSEAPTIEVTVSAGPDFSVGERAFVSVQGEVLDATNSTTLSWSQVSGPMVQINDAQTVSPGFRAPATNADESIVLRLTASDAGSVSATDDVTITILDSVTSPQGIDEDTGERRDRARRGRNGNRPMVDSREVRTFDGTSNNIANPTWGAAFTQLARWGAVDYEDGISAMAGSERPSARVVSNNVVAQDEGQSIPNTFGTTDFLWQWGQFLDHDIGITDGAEESADIAVPTGDNFFDPDSTGQQVILFSRAFFDSSTGTDAGNPRQQENEITAWIDGSMIYGSDDERAAALRVSEESPFLATSDGNLLPFNSVGATNANAFGVDDDQLFLAGDVRANEQVGLAVMHTLWVREHNRIAAILLDDNPTAEGEAIYQATRRLVIAKIQKITYDEYLPALIGADALATYQGYNADENPGMFNEFSVAAYRYGHSLVNETLLRIDANGATVADGDLALREAFFTAPSILDSEESLEPILRGMASQLSQRLDAKANNDLRNFLFGAPGGGGLDLLSLNIQRGRDHGVPSYNDMREVFGLTRVAVFADITSDVTLQTALAVTYNSVDDIDLWVGGLSEDPLTAEGSQLGELFRAMHVRQFEAFRDADRFWYERDLTSDELRRIESTTLADVIRDNTTIGDEIQDNVFFVP
ncbi:MAG: peroxidase family protein [Pseudomonadota bacterium]